MRNDLLQISQEADCVMNEEKRCSEYGGKLPGDARQGLLTDYQSRLKLYQSGEAR
jgi:hypothetical protein